MHTTLHRPRAEILSYAKGGGAQGNGGIDKKTISDNQGCVYSVSEQLRVGGIALLRPVNVVTRDVGLPFGLPP